MLTVYIFGNNSFVAIVYPLIERVEREYTAYSAIC